MHCKIDPILSSNECDSSRPCLDISVYKQRLLETLHDFPYEFVNLEKDEAILELLIACNDELNLDLTAEHLKEAIMAKLTSNAPCVKPAKFYNPALEVVNVFDLVSKHKDTQKKQQFDHLQQINQDLDLLGKVLGHFQSASTEDKIDLSSQDSMKSMVDLVQSKFGFPATTKPYVWENKQEVVAFLNQKIKELTHRSSEAMLHLQHHADQLKTLVDLTKDMIQKNSECVELILRKSQG